MTGLRIYNSESKKKEIFAPLSPGLVSIYVCGPTVYDFLHVGNFRGPVFFNLVRNWFERTGYKVRYVSNFTDIDDRILQRAQTLGVKPVEVSERYIAEYKTDFQNLGLKPQDANPKVTEHIEDIVALIQTLIEREMAYVVDGEVLFSVRKFSDYGKLSKRDIEDMRTGTRIQPGENKRDPMDFALWKPAQAGQESWPSPWGQGRPGWHIECSAMIRSLFGDQIDIHGGGMDLIFPHHENEVAQSEGATGKPFVKYWMHWNMINFGDRKMSKSIGNIKTARDFLKDYDAEIFKYMLLSVHYRSPSDFSDAGIERAIAGLARIYSALAQAERILAVGSKSGGPGQLPEAFLKTLSVARARFAEALNDDFNTPEAFAEVFNVIRAFNSIVRPGRPSADLVTASQTLLDWVREHGALMSLLQKSPKAFLQSLDDLLLKQKGLERSEIEALVHARVQAKANKDYALADQLRDQLVAKGISVSDTVDGVHWEVAKG